MKQSLHLKNELLTDFKAAAIAAELIESGDFDPEQVAIIPGGPQKRAYAKEMSSHSFYYSESKRRDCINLETHQEGFYDMLPEGLFHNPPTGSAGMSEDQMVEDVQLRRAEERYARQFFMPFEAELNHLRTILELYENRLDKKTTYDELTRIFASEWKEFELFNKEQSIIWMHLLPVIQQKRNDLDFLGQLLSVLFKTSVQVYYRQSNVKPKLIEDDMQFRLGAGALGIHSIIGASFHTDEEEVIINIKPADTAQLLSFMPGTAHAHIIDLAVSYLIPVDLEVKVNLLDTPAHCTGSLGAESENTYLGFTTYL